MAESEQGTGWPCDDYRAPLTCWTVPSGRKTLVCQGCREAFPNGAEIQALFREIKAEGWDEGYEAGYQMARRWGHFDSWEDEPSNPHRVTPPETEETGR